MGSWGRLVPAGGRSGILDSNKACARLIRPLTSPSSSSVTGVSGSCITSIVCIFRSVGGELESACRRVNSVGTGDGSGGAADILVRENVKSRLEGLRLRVDVEVVELSTGTGCTDTAGAAALTFTDVRSSSAWLPLEAAATISMASSSLDSTQSDFKSGSRTLLPSRLRRDGAAANTSLTDPLRERGAREAVEGCVRNRGGSVSSDGLLYGGGCSAGVGTCT